MDEREGKRVKLNILQDIQDLFWGYGLNYKRPDIERKTQEIAGTIYQLLEEKENEL
jgi:hypothetical protein